MNYLYKILLGVFFAALVFSLCASLYYYNKINHIYEEEVTYVFDENPKHHISLIIADNGDVYWQNFKEGAYEAAKANDAAVEMNIIEGINVSDGIIEYLNIAGRSKVDGVIVLGENSAAEDEAINRLVDMGIDVVVVGQESINTKTSLFVGTNSYEYGARAGMLLKEVSSTTSTINVAVILSADYVNDEKNTSSQGNTLVSAINDISQEQYNMNLVATKKCQSELLGAEEIVRDILTEHEEVNAIFCTSAKDTEAAARVVIERNLVGEVAIVGTGVTDSIVSYIEKGVVFGTIDKNGYQAGYSSVELICSIDEDVLLPDYIVVDLDVYTAINIPSYPKD